MAKSSKNALVSLDALIPRDAFEIKDQDERNMGRNILTIGIRDLEQSSFLYPFLRKPDFQRETNEWDAAKICEFIESFLDGDLIPAVILWRGSRRYFVVDGSHRLSCYLLGLMMIMAMVRFLKNFMTATSLTNRKRQLKKLEN